MDNLQSLINDSVQLMFIGMGTVFIILTMLIFLISFSSKLLSRYEEEPPYLSAPVKTQSTETVSTSEDSQLVAVISSAIRAYKNKHSAK